MVKMHNFLKNDDIVILDKQGPFQAIEYVRDLSVTSSTSMVAYYNSKMGVRKRQLLCHLSGNSITMQSGAMQWMAGDIDVVTGVKSASDLFGKVVRGNVTGESAIKPEYKGYGIVALEPTEKHLILINTGSWNNGIVLDDGYFLACESSLKQKVIARSNLSSAVLGKEGLFNLSLSGNGWLCLESRIPKEEIMEMEIENDVVKIDGNLAIAWSRSLDFTVERSTKTFIGSAASGEGLVNVYRGTGKIWMAPINF